MRDSVSLEVTDNSAVGGLDPGNLIEPVLSAATATTRKILIALDLDPVAPQAGRALDPSASPVRAG